jgi:hypothetical protein
LKALGTLKVTPDMQIQAMTGKIGSTNARDDNAAVGAASVSQRKVQRNLFLLLMAFLLPIFGLA